MRSFIQPLLSFSALFVLFCFVNSARSVPIGPSGSSLGFGKRYLSAADRIFPYGKLSDRYLRVNDADSGSYLRSLIPDASGGRAYNHKDQDRHIHRHNHHHPAQHTQHEPSTLLKPISISNHNVVQHSTTWTSKIKLCSTTFYTAALERMQKITSRLRWPSPVGCKDKSGTLLDKPARSGKIRQLMADFLWT